MSKNSNFLKSLERDFTFSSDKGRFTRKDLDNSSNLVEKYFGMSKDPSQIDATPENKKFIFENLQDYMNMVKKGNEFVGSAFIVPCSRKTMNLFLSRKLTESELFEIVKDEDIENPECLYLCSAIIKKKYRRRGLAFLAFVKLIERIVSSKKIKPVIFAWNYSKEGKNLTRKIMKEFSLEFRERE